MHLTRFITQLNVRLRQQITTIVGILRSVIVGVIRIKFITCQQSKSLDHLVKGKLDTDDLFYTNCSQIIVLCSSRFVPISQQPKTASQ
jgi:hypothetical protein